METTIIKKIVEAHDGKLGGVLSILEEIQNKYSYLPADALKTVSKLTGHSLVDLYGVATFYRAFSLNPRGKHIVSVCLGTACHVRGSKNVVDRFEAELDIKAGQTTPDKEFTLETVNCLGACALGPIVVVDGHYFSNVNEKMVKDIIAKTKEGLDGDISHEHSFPLEVSCPHCNHSLMDSKNPLDKLPSIRVTVSIGQQHGWLILSAVYGSYTVKSEFPLPKNEIYYFFCPHCHTQLISSTPCSDCDAPMVPMINCRGGVVQICSRRGCKAHMLDLSGANL
ncbi:MAG: NAD(P)H-dependent oxidoreductase subunit E [Planctomycetota bacterium]